MTKEEVPREPFIQEAVYAFVEQMSRRRGLDMTYWNQ